MKICVFFYFDRAIARTANEPPGSRAVVHCSSPKSFDQQTPFTYNTHPSKGNSASAFPAPAPISPDWLLIYRYDDDVLVLTLTRTGSHSDLFNL
ncbi:type II toxin-antitoxin system mRNA interferase toxin, RelE/StbE family [Coprococcus comes]|uniref:type II toxin-antitoxin system mRNA interferase toxin, RelE/StbE family n=1 Tax=Coprococcus comes TaxID=410072 RepID=UPI001FA88743|nr:type II toxin-antitoxin system mRNA interferase toxin, RelE/StbE family [Coprococcus comes]